MTHDPLCLRLVGKGAGPCICWLLRQAYRNGYNDHARSRAYAEAVYGPYRLRNRGEDGP